ncbi:MAG: NAD(P)/FAD-dependent oxidoreductase [Xanthobacteraceae bacterium]|jgi:phytoene dehydrogenase-like protein
MPYDAVVVGAGVNGLAAALHLAAKGWKVVVVERAEIAGGAVKTREITQPGFRHDLYAMNLGLFAGSPFFAAHKDRLTAHGIDFVGAEHCFATAFPDGSWLGVEKNPEANAKRIAALSPADAERWRAMTAAFAQDAPHIFALLGTPLPSWQALRLVFAAWRARGTAWVADTARLLVASPREWLDENFENAKLKTMLAVWGMHLDFSPDCAGGALFPYLESMADQSFGMALGRGGADTIIAALTRAIAAACGEVRLGAPVQSVAIEGGAAKGVVLAGGERIEATRAVIANLHPRVLFGKLVPAASAAAQRLARFRPGPATMMIHLALDDLPAWSAGAELRRFAYVHLAPSLAVMAKTYTDALDGLLPAEPALVVGQPTAIDPSRAPAGKHVLWVQVRVLPSRIRGDAAGSIGGREWDDVKEAYADRVIGIIERYAPGFAANILARAVHSPADLERDNPNLVGGDSLGGSHHLDQNFLFRPAFGWSRYRTPVDRLYMVGASTWPGAGTGAGSGFMLAKMLAGV